MRHRLTKADLIARLGDLPALEAEMETNEFQRTVLSERWEELRRLADQLRSVDEVFEGQPLSVSGEDGSNFRVEEVGEPDGLRWGYVNPIWPPDDEVDPDPDVPVQVAGWLLQLSGAGTGQFANAWKKYGPDQRAAAVLAAKRFAAHGVVPIPDAAKE